MVTWKRNSWAGSESIRGLSQFNWAVSNLIEIMMGALCPSRIGCNLINWILYILFVSFSWWLFFKKKKFFSLLWNFSEELYYKRLLVRYSKVALIYLKEHNYHLLKRTQQTKLFFIKITFVPFCLYLDYCVKFQTEARTSFRVMAWID